MIVSCTYVYESMRTRTMAKLRHIIIITIASVIYTYVPEASMKES